MATNFRSLRRIKKRKMIRLVNQVVPIEHSHLFIRVSPIRHLIQQNIITNLQIHFYLFTIIFNLWQSIIHSI
jgi:hypothetical protein